MHGIAFRLNGNNKEASQITVDQQSQFNKGQKTYSEFCASVKDVPPLVNGLGLPVISHEGMPTIPLTFKSGTDSAGLEIVDVYLWIFKRMMENKEIPIEINSFIQKQIPKSRTDEVSINAISSRWEEWFKNIPEPSEEQMIKAKEHMALEEERRIKGMGK